MHCGYTLVLLPSDPEFAGRGINSDTCPRIVTSRVDYCNVVLAESPRSTTDKLQRVMNAVARVISNTQKYDSGLSLLRHEELHWLDVIDRVRYK